MTGNSRTWKGKLYGKYQKFYDNYYYGTLIFHKVIIARIEGKISDSNKEFEKVIHHLKRARYATIIRNIFLIIALLTKKFKKKTYILDVTHRFNYFTSEFSKVIRDNNCKYIMHDSSKKNLSYYLFLLVFSFSSNKITDLLIGSSSLEFDDLIENQDLMSKLNNLVYKQVIFTSKLLIALNIQAITLSDNLSQRKFLLVESAKICNIPCYSIPHGYPQSSLYHALICSDKIFTWDLNQKNLILEEDPKKDVVVLGYPRFDKRRISQLRVSIQKNPHKITYATSINQNERMLVYEQLKILKGLGFLITIRLHPKEIKDTKLLNEAKKLIEEHGFVLSEADLLEDIISSRIIIGNTTSVLYEAHLIENNSIQLSSDELQIIPFYKSIVSIKIDEIHELSNQTLINDYLSRNENEQLVDSFYQKLSELFF